ncbi:DUF6428 family protein [Negadavirga shengliensis]|uniref:DUF6428 family protein n=1 Tax=Negadavirga shengliensis TaxID=1389218 RepID=A0ABV9T289_9BACT
MDCGGARNEWEEVHVQLWESQSPEPNHQVNTTKALKIFEAVGKSRPTHEDAEVKFEYGNGLFHTAVLPVQNIVVDDSNLVVKLMAEQTTCKAKDRAATPGEKAAACCGTSVPSLGVRSTETSVRTAASGCC